MFPALYISHGSPAMIITDCPARDFLAGLGTSLGRPRAILAISAHWDTAAPSVNAPERNATIHDFYGFPPVLYRITYPAPGSRELAAAVTSLLDAAGLPTTTDPQRGLDHGAWAPLALMYPEADIPVVQLSLQTQRGPAHHLRLGTALQALRDQDVLILASGSFTHNLREFHGHDLFDPAPAWVTDFTDWMDAAIQERRVDDLVDYRRLAPNAVRNHPTDEHLLPLYVALGAGRVDQPIEHLHDSVTYGVLRLDAYAFH
ncbi:MAG: class III extradiol ring-cleavage dioxygenase [Azospirillaceae bacterium]|nr:class III extradiol ring-cleavage dioxygenase [Azospirillaceae bacterium]